MQWICIPQKLLDEDSSASGVDFSGARIKLKTVEKKMAELLPTPVDASPALTLFYPLMRKKLGSSIAIVSERFMREFQEEQLTKLGKPKAEQDLEGLSEAEVREIGMENDKNRSTLAFHSKLSSIVKDTRSIWVKDHLLSIMNGLLNEQDKVQLLSDLLERQNVVIPSSPRAKFFEVYETFNALLQESIRELIQYLATSESRLSESRLSESRKGPKVDFLEHDFSFIGARQDTYLSPEKVQLPGIWKRWLHVVELRKSNLDLLRIAYEKLTGKDAEEIPIAPEMTLEEYKPNTLDERAWETFVGLMTATPLGEIDHEDLIPLYARVDKEREAEIDLRKKGELEDASESGMSKGSSSSLEEKSKESLPEEKMALRLEEKTEIESKGKQDNESKGAKEKTPFNVSEIQRIPNNGGGDCLYYALAGRNLEPIHLQRARTEVADVRREMPAGSEASNANQVALALYQSEVPLQVVRELTTGRHLVGNAAYAALQEIPGMYAGEEELIQWCNSHEMTVAVLFQNGNVALFSGAGRRDIAIDPANRYAETLATLLHANLSLYKTPNHWERISHYRNTALPGV